jgi:hypothetical protein
MRQTRSSVGQFIGNLREGDRYPLREADRYPQIGCERLARTW